MNKIILIGAGGHARSCIDVIEAEGRFKIAGLVEKAKESMNESQEHPIIGTDVDLEDLRQQCSHALITVGQIKSPAIRIKLYKMLIDLNFNLPVIKSPNAYISNSAQIGSGTIVMHGAIINANAVIGENCIINNQALIEHDALIGDHCHISTSAIINGEVSIGNESFIGSGSITKHCISVGNNCVVGAGAIIKSDVRSNQIIRKQ